MIKALKREMEVDIHGIEAQTIENLLKNWVDRLGYYKASPPGKKRWIEMNWNVAIHMNSV